jgi:hypothetical protein
MVREEQEASSHPMYHFLSLLTVEAALVFDVELLAINGKK